MNDFYVYAWLRPCGTPFYIGKGRGRRDETPKYSNQLFQRILAKIRSSGFEPTVVRLHENLTEDESFDLERALILLHGRRDNGTGILANLTDGGEGTSGRVLSAETREKISSALAGKTRGPLSAEAKANLSAALTGRKLTDEHVAKVAAAQNGKKLSAEHVEKMSAAFKGKKMPPRSGEHRANLSTALTGRKHSEAALAKMSVAFKGRKHSEESRSKISASLIGREVSEETRAKIGAAHVGMTHSEETKAKISAAFKGKTCSEEHVAKVTESVISAPPKKNNTSGYKGVHFYKARGKWQAYIKDGEKRRSLGYFHTPEDAARAYDEAAYAAWGDGCYLNFERQQ